MRVVVGYSEVFGGRRGTIENGYVSSLREKVFDCC
jgi:hypothetical protein